MVADERDIDCFNNDENEPVNPVGNLIHAVNKRAWAANPYIIAREDDAGKHIELIGRDNEIQLIRTAWYSNGTRPPLNPLLVGAPGVGKNGIVFELARKTGQALYIMQGHEDFTAEDLACSVRFSDENNTKMDYVLSPLATSMLLGGICFIDEIAKIRPSALALLVSVLDERRCIDSTLLCERIYAHENFRFVAATNTGEVNTLPDFIRSRMRPLIDIGYPPREGIEQIIQLHTEDENNYSLLLREFWTLWSKEKRSPTSRDIIQLFTLASNLRDYELKTKTNKHRVITKNHLRTAFEELYNPGS